MKNSNKRRSIKKILFMIEDKNFLYNIKDLQKLFENNMSVIFNSDYYKKNINNEHLDLREINKIIKKIVKAIIFLKLTMNSYLKKLI